MISPDHPEIALNEVAEGRYKPELELVDRYNAFAAELLRLALLGLAVYGFLLSNGLANPAVARLADEGAASIRTYVLASVVSFGAAAVCALAYRYMVSETFRLHVEAVRASMASAPSDGRVEERLQQRRRLIWLCIAAKATAVAALGAGAVATTVAISLLVLQRPS